MQQDTYRRRAPRTLGPVAAAILVSFTACGGSPPGPTPVDPPSIVCPADVVLGGVGGGGQAVSFATPAATGGSPPVSVTCTPAPGSFFPLGTTSVSCVAQDATARRASCAFNVTLTAPTLGALEFVAFGDSVTEGQNGRTLRGLRVVDVPNAYPTKLQALFDLEYPGQGIVVVNKGEGGKSLETDVKRLPGVLSQYHPDALLLLHGYNDLSPCAPGAAASDACRGAIDVVVNKLRECIQIAREPAYAVRYIFVSTLTPPGPVTGNSDRRRDAGAIAQTNARLGPMVQSERAILVDSHSLFLGHEAEYVDTDGLHLRPAGNDVVARAFFSGIKSAIPASQLRIR